MWLLHAHRFRVKRRARVPLTHFVSESGGNGTLLGSRSCKFEPLLVEKGCITPCTSSARGNFSMNALNGNGSGCYPWFQSAAWKEGLNLLDLWREIKPIFPTSAGVVKLIAFKRWKCYAQIGNCLQKRTQSFEPQKGCSICLGDSENSDLERTWVEWHHFSDNLGISLVSIWEHRVMQWWELRLFALCWWLKESENKSLSFMKLKL